MSFDTLVLSSAWPLRRHRSAGITQAIVLSAEAIDQQPLEAFPDTSRGRVTWRTLISSTKTPSNELTVGLATCAVGSGYLAHHRHMQAEFYHVLSGHGTVTIDGKEHAVEKGAVVYRPGNAEHGICCTSDTEDLVWLYCFAANDFGEIHYRFS